MENSKMISLPVILKGDNYLLWSWTTKTALCSRGLWAHITDMKNLELDSEREEAAVKYAGKAVMKDDGKAVVAVGYGALKFADLKKERSTRYKFSYDEMLCDKVLELGS